MPSLFRAHMPLAVLATGFLALVSAAQCTSTSGDNPENDASTRACAAIEDCIPFPASSCQSNSELAYYTEAKCVQSHCQWSRQITNCPCSHGGCTWTTTAGGFPGIGTEGGILNVADATNVADVIPDDVRIDPPDGGACDVDASDDADACPLPPSVCVDPRWLAYFVNPVCSAAGRCEWEVRYRNCVVCAGSGCINNITR